MLRRYTIQYDKKGVYMITLDFDKAGGLVPAIAQDAESGEVLMVAYMNREAWEKTLSTGIVHYFSRSRNKLWKKGETSGNIQEVKEIRIDCDNDCLLLKIHQIGNAACHTGYKSCFYRKVTGNSLIVDGEKIFDPREKYGVSDG
jgi:phosphoribosyl-AMP cyclohydrolase